MTTKIDEKPSQSKVIDGLYIGNIGAAVLDYGKYDVVLNLSEIPIKELRRGYHKTTLIEIPLHDTEHVDLSKYVPYTNCIIDQALKTDKKILVNCYAGISRSSAVVIAYLMSLGVGYDDAYKYLQKKRRIINPNDRFVTSLRVGGGLFTV